MIRLNELRGNRTQAQMAQILGLPRETYRNYEVGNREPSLETLVKMAEFFNVSVDYLLGRETFTENLTAGATKKDDLTTQEGELLYLFRSLSPYLQGLTLDTVRSWAGKPGATDLHKKA